MVTLSAKVYTFRCPTCLKLFQQLEPGEPCCTGPSEMRDDHPMTLMLLHRIDELAVAPALARARARGPLRMR